MKIIMYLFSCQLSSYLASFSLRTADAIPVVASFPPKNSVCGGSEATTGNAPAVRRLSLVLKVRIFRTRKWPTRLPVLSSWRIKTFSLHMQKTRNRGNEQRVHSLSTSRSAG